MARLTSERAVILAGAVAAAGMLCACGEPASGDLTWSAGTIPASLEVHARSERDVEALLSDVRGAVDRAVASLDPRAKDGELARLSRLAADAIHEDTPIDLYACLNLGLQYARVSGGAYDPTVGALRALYEARWGTDHPLRPAEIDVALSRIGWEKVTLEPEALGVGFRAPGIELDLGAVGSGCALDWAARQFARPGSLAGAIRLDGVHRAWQRPPGEPSWQLRLEDPRVAERELLSIRVIDRGVAVCGQADPRSVAGGSSTGARLLLDPRTGHPAASDLLAVVTTADSAADAAGLCHALYVSGSLEGATILSRMRRVEAFLLVSQDAKRPYALATVSLRGRIEPSPDLAREIEGDVRYLLPP